MTEVPLGRSLGALLALSEAPIRSEPENPILGLAQWFVDHDIEIVPAKGKMPIGGVYAAKKSTDGIIDGYAVKLGNGIIALDYDLYHNAIVPLEAFEKTRTVKSGSGKGYHLYYRVPEELSNFGGELHQGITIRGGGSVVIGPGSKHPDGGIYELEYDVDISDAPKEIIKKLEEIKDRKEKEASIHIGAAIKPERFESDKNWIAKLQATDVNDRSEATYDLMAYSTERGATDEELAWIISNFKPATDKGNVEKELARLVSKLRVEHAHPGKPCDSAGCPNPPQWMNKGIEPLDFFSARPELAYIQQAAFSRIVSPKAVTVAVIARAIASVPVEFVLPPIIGEVASLNFFACFVGESGGGKGTSTKLAEKLFDFKQTGVKYTTSTPGSGEGVVSTYLKIKDNKWQQVFDSALINFDEIDNFKASTDRQGSTLSGIIRQGFMGEQIGGTYSKSVKELLPNTYRMALQLSAQPLRSAGLLEDSDGGTPQRFVFVQTANPEQPSVDDLPQFPAIMAWRAPQPVLDLKNRKIEASKPKEVLGSLDAPVEVKRELIEIEVDPQIIRFLQERQIKASRTGKTAAVAHSGLCQEKVAFGLAYLNGRMNITKEDWDLSAIVMSWSKQAVNEIEEANNHKKLKEQMARTTAAADRQEYIEKRLSNAAVERVANNILRWAEKGYTSLKGENGFRLKIKASDRNLIEEALELIETNKKGTFDKDTNELKLK